MPTPRVLIKKKPGRKPMTEDMRNRTFRLSDADYAMLQSLGGVKFLRAVTRSYWARREHAALVSKQARGPLDI